MCRHCCCPGVEIRFNSGTGIDIGHYSSGHFYGAINAQGTEADPIIFTSNAETPAPGDWAGIYFRDQTNDGLSLLEHCVVEYEPDTGLRDTEQVPLLEEGGVEAFIKREVLTFVSDAWIDSSKSQIGYEISFSRNFYRPAAMRALEEIKADIYALEQETEGLLEQIVGEASQ